MTIAPSLDTLLTSSYFRDDDQLKEMIISANERRDAVFYACNFTTRKIEYISPVCEVKLGYPPKEFIKGGPDFIYGITASDVAPKIVQQHHEYMKRRHPSNFDPKQFLIQEYPTVFLNKKKETVSLTCIGVMLTYLPDGDWELGVAFLTDPNERAISKSRDLLRQLKERHNEVYVHPPIVVDSLPSLSVVHVTSERLDERITLREREVLKLLAQGFSTSEIAGALHITDNTTETHRKHLLEKFTAKNSAELVKKASKVFWLE